MDLLVAVEWRGTLLEVARVGEPAWLPLDPPALLHATGSGACLRQGGSALPLAAGDVHTCGALTVRVRAVPQVVAVGRARGRDLAFARTLAITAEVLGALVAVLATSPVPENGFVTEATHFPTPERLGARFAVAMPARVPVEVEGRFLLPQQPGRGRAGLSAPRLLHALPAMAATPGLGAVIESALASLHAGQPTRGDLAPAARDGHETSGLGDLRGPGALTSGGGRGRGGYGDLELGGRAEGAARLVPGRVLVAGGLDRDVVGKLSRRHWNQVRFCFESALQAGRSVGGRVEVQLVIATDGGVREVAILEDTAGVGACVERVVRAWRFPASGGEAIVRYPWVLRA